MPREDVVGVVRNRKETNDHNKKDEENGKGGPGSG